ncbi:magnesium chelatase domain-containing protein [Aquipuribacter sp. SD81]|uniref:magnesium chelatase domain-containing protein n=1 Tax=Aquipuribacter sp. SD81 TaxID=3127703 RepID=UPI003017A999
MSGTRLGRTVCAALLGLDGHPVEVEAQVSQGLVQWIVTGLPDAGVLEARDRVRAALTASGWTAPQQRLTVNLSPAGLPKSGTAFDLGVAVAVLGAMGEVPEHVARMGHVGELGLDGGVRRTPGVLPAVLGLRRAGVRDVVVPASAAAEAALVPGVRVHGVTTLRDAVALHRGEERPPPPPAPQLVAPTGSGPVPGGDLCDVVGQPMGRRALEVVAAGGHHLLMLGPPTKTLQRYRLGLDRRCGCN